MSSNPADNEPSWPVCLYRKTLSEGWQQLKASDRKVALYATPRCESIVVKKLRLKFSLNIKDKKSLVIRRRHCIMIQSQNKPLVFVFEFLSEPACLAFSDRFILLNPTIAKQSDNDSKVAEPPNRNEVSSPADTNQVLYYIARLLNDPDFGEYVNALESSINGHDDHAMMLKSMIIDKKG